MEDSTSREKVLKKVRDALIYKYDNPYPQMEFESPVFNQPGDSLDVCFAEELTKVSGKFIYCEDENEYLSSLKFLAEANGWQSVFCQETWLQEGLEKAGIAFNSADEDLTEITVAITGCEYLIARLGSAMVSSAQSGSRRIFVFPDVHLIVGFTSQLVPDLKQAFQNIRKKYLNNYPSMISLITGPSRTADIEKTLVMGAHGPRELYVFLIDDSANA